MKDPATLSRYQPEPGTYERRGASLRPSSLKAPSPGTDTLYITARASPDELKHSGTPCPPPKPPTPPGGNCTHRNRPFLVFISAIIFTLRSELSLPLMFPAFFCTAAAVAERHCPAIGGGGGARSICHSAWNPDCEATATRAESLPSPPARRQRGRGCGRPASQHDAARSQAQPRQPLAPARHPATSRPWRLLPPHSATWDW